MRLAASWSGGKESCFACHKAMLNGFGVTRLLNFISKEKKCMSHGLDSNLMVAQSQAIGIPIIQREVTWDAYEEGFKETMRGLKQLGIEGAVFGDIDMQEHKDWVNRVCNEVGIMPVEPLWGLDPEQILGDFIDAGFEAIVVTVKADLFGEEWLGRKVDESFLEDIRKLHIKHNVHICGELGEYHTLVIDGPIFRRRINIVESKKMLKEGYWKYRLLDISRYQVEEE